MDPSAFDPTTRIVLQPFNTESASLSVLSTKLKWRKEKNRATENPRLSRKLKGSKSRRWREMRPESGCRVTEMECKKVESLTAPGNAGDHKRAVSLCEVWEVDSGFSSEVSPPPSGRNSPCVEVRPCDLVALDCEMVGTGPKGQCSELARCSLVNYSGTVIYDKYVLPRQPITDLRTRWSGIKMEHLRRAVPYNKARKEILDILEGKIIIGHALRHDFMALDISVPRDLVRDTSSMPRLRQMYGTPHMRVSLKKLSDKLLNRRIQTGREGHCSVEDARAALDLYKLVEVEWEKSVPSSVQTSALTTRSTGSLEQYMEDQYWLENLDCNELEPSE